MYLFFKEDTLLNEKLSAKKFSYRKFIMDEYFIKEKSNMMNDCNVKKLISDELLL